MTPYSRPGTRWFEVDASELDELPLIAIAAFSIIAMIEEWRTAD